MDDLATVLEARNCGVGGQALGSVVEHLRAASCPKVLLDTYTDSEALKYFNLGHGFPITTNRFTMAFA